MITAQAEMIEIQEEMINIMEEMIESMTISVRVLTIKAVETNILLNLVAKETILRTTQDQGQLLLIMETRRGLKFSKNLLIDCI